jgi:hypothetical protein
MAGCGVVVLQAIDKEVRLFPSLIRHYGLEIELIVQRGYV